jgi:HSP20 family protein
MSSDLSTNNSTSQGFYNKDSNNLDSSRTRDDWVSTDSNRSNNENRIGLSNWGGNNNDVGLSNWMGPSGGNFWNWNEMLQPTMQLTPSLQEQEKQYVMTIQRPSGLNKNDLKLEVHKDILTISGGKENESSMDRDGVQSSSYSSTSFSRSLRLPDNVDPHAIAATFEQDGSLQVVLPKLDDGKMMKPRSIQIK